MNRQAEWESAPFVWKNRPIRRFLTARAGIHVSFTSPAIPDGCAAGAA